MMNFLWLAVFVAIGFPVALSIELFLRAQRRQLEHAALSDDEFMPLPDDSGIARRMLRTASGKPVD